VVYAVGGFALCAIGWIGNRFMKMSDTYVQKSEHENAINGLKSEFKGEIADALNRFETTCGELKTEMAINRKESREDFNRLISALLEDRRK
jgi:hypothetical protein